MSALPKHQYSSNLLQFTFREDKTQSHPSTVTMNKWRLLLLSVLSLLQSVSAERNFVDGRDRYRSDIRLSIGDPYRVHNSLHGLRQLKAPNDLVYRARDAELTRAPAIRHLKHRELHGRFPSIQNTELILTDHRRTSVADRLSVYVQSDRRGANLRINDNVARTKIDVRRNRIVKQNGDRDYLDNSRPSIRDDSKENVIRLHIVEAGRYDDISLKKFEPQSRNRRIHYKRNEAEHERHARLIDLSNTRTLDNKRFVKRELVQKTIYKEPKFRRRIVRQLENAFEKTDKRSRDDTSRLGLKNENTQEMEVSRSNILRRHTNYIDKENIREKRSIDSRLASSVHLIRENRERRHVIQIKQRPDRIYTRDSIEKDTNTKFQRNEINQFRRDQSISNIRILSNAESRNNLNADNERQKVNQLRETTKISRENIENSVHDRSQNMYTERNRKLQNINTENTRFRRNNENHRQCSSRSLPIEERVTEFHNARIIRDRLTKSQRDTILLELNAKPDTQQDRSQLLSNRARVKNEIHLARNTRQERLQNIIHEAHLSREKQHSMQRTRENIEDIRRDRSRSLATGEKSSNRQNTQAERVPNTGHVKALARERQHLMRIIHIDERPAKVNAGLRNARHNEEQILTRQRESSLTREQPMYKLSRSTTEINDMRRTRYRSISNEERVERERQIFRNTRDERINTRRGTLLSSERQYSISELSATVKLVENTENSRRHIYRRSSTGERLLNEIQNTRDENVLNTRPLLNNERQPSSHKLYINIRSTANTPKIHQDRSRSLSTGDRTVNEIQHARNIREERREMKFNALLISRRLMPLVTKRRHLMSKLNVNKRSYDDNTVEISQQRSRSLTTGERLTNAIRHTRNDRTTNEIRHTRQALEERATNAMRRARYVREDRATNEFVHTRNTQERHSKTSLQDVRLLIRDSRDSTSKRRANKISMDDIRRQNSQSLPIGKRDINEVSHPMNVRDERATYETQRTSNIREVRSANEIRLIRNTQKEKLANKIQRTRHILEEKLSNTGRRSVPTEERVIDELEVTLNNIRKRNMQGVSTIREEKRSLLRFSASLIPISNAEIENTFVLKWQYLFYILQGIYLCSLFINNPKENGELKRRATGWFSVMKYLKIN